MKTLKKIVKKLLNESIDGNQLKKFLNKLEIENYKILGEGQHGVAILNTDNNKVYKLTSSFSEFDIAKKQKAKNLSSLPKIYSLGIIDNVYYYVRDIYTEINDDLAEKISEETDDIIEFFFSKSKDVRKSQTDLDYHFDDKFLSFLNNLKIDLGKLGVLPDNFDNWGIGMNIYLDENNNYILVDF